MNKPYSLNKYGTKFKVVLIIDLLFQNYYLSYFSFKM